MEAAANPWRPAWSSVDDDMVVSNRGEGGHSRGAFNINVKLLKYIGLSALSHPLGISKAVKIKAPLAVASVRNGLGCADGVMGKGIEIDRPAQWENVQLHYFCRRKLPMAITTDRRRWQRRCTDCWASYYRRLWAMFNGLFFCLSNLMQCIV